MLLFIFDYHWFETAWWEALGFAFVEVVGYGIVFYVNVYFLKTLTAKKRLLKILISLIVIVVYIVFVRFSGLEKHLYEAEGLRNLFSLWLNASLFTTLAWLFYFAEKNQLTQQKNLQLVAANKQLQIDALKARMNPHFLFNVLNNLNALIARKDEKVPNFVAKLSSVLRYSVDAGTQQKIPLAKELAYVQDYLDLVKMQEPASDNIDFYVDGTTEQYQIIPFILTSILENAIKHGDIQHNEHGFLHIFAEIDEKQFLFEVINSVSENKGNINKNSLQVGLKNIREQLSLYYGDAFILIEDKEKGSYKSRLVIQNLDFKP